LSESHSLLLIATNGYTTLFCDGIDWDENLTTFGVLDSIGPPLHFWYSVLQLLFCKCNARCCLKNLLQIGQFDMITYTGFPMLAMDANFRKMTQSCQLLQSWYPSCFLVLHFSYKTNLWNNVGLGTVTNKWYLTIDLFRWSYNMYCVYIHAVLNPQKFGHNIVHSCTHTYLPWTKNKFKVLLYLSTTQISKMTFITLFSLTVIHVPGTYQMKHFEWLW